MFKPYVGKLANVVYKEGRETVSKKGHIISISPDGKFLELETFHNKFLINTSDIISLKLFGEGEHESR